MNVTLPSLPKLSLAEWVGNVASYFSRDEVPVIQNVDTLRSHKKAWEKAHGGRYIAFTFSAIALSAKLSKIDGPANENEVKSFYKRFPLPNGSQAQAGESFYDAYNDPTDSRHYAQKIALLYADDRDLLKELMDALVSLAMADAPINSRELNFLRKTAIILGFSEADLRSMLRTHIIPDAATPYHLFGLSRKTTFEELKKVYRQKVRDCHPDMLSRYDVPEEILDICVEKFDRLTIAYDVIKRERRFK